MTVKMQMRLRLVAIVDFRRGVPTHVEELRSIQRWPLLGDSDVVLLIAQTRAQLAFVYRDRNVAWVDRSGKLATGADRQVYAHLRLQLDRQSPWNPLMLKNYAEMVGIDLLGLKKFEDFAASRQDRHTEK